MRRVAALSIAILVAASALPAFAADGNERAAAIFRQAQQAFARKNYAAAAAAFEEAAMLAPHPAAWLDAGESWELDGNLARAAEACDRALAIPDIAESHQREAEARLARLIPKIGTLDVRSARTLVMKIDGAGEVHVPGKRRVAPGRHELVVIDLAGAPMQTLTVDVARGETRIVDLAPQSPAVAAMPPRVEARGASDARDATTAPPRGGGPPLGSWIAFGASAAAAATGAVLGGMTLSARSDFDASPSAETRDRFYRARTATNVAWAIAGGAAAAGVIVWIATPSGSPVARLGVTAGDFGLGLMHETRF